MCLQNVTYHQISPVMFEYGVRSQSKFLTLHLNRQMKNKVEVRGELIRSKLRQTNLFYTYSVCRVHCRG